MIDPAIPRLYAYHRALREAARVLNEFLAGRKSGEPADGR